MNTVLQRNKLILYRQLLRRTEYLSPELKDLAVKKIKWSFRLNKFESDQKKINILIDQARDWIVKQEKKLRGRLEVQSVKEHHQNVLGI